MGTNTPQEQVVVNLPVFPPEIQNRTGFTGWNIRTVNTEGQIINQFFPKETRSFSVFFLKNVPSPILAYPLTNDGEFFKPAGSIYPAEIQTGVVKKLHPSWENGFAAEFLTNLITKADQGAQTARKTLSFFNWNRFIEQCQKQENPWILDKEKLYDALSREKINVYSFTPMQTISAEIYLHPPPEWLLQSYIPAPVIYPDRDKNEITLQLQRGVNVFLTNRSLFSAIKKEDGIGLVISETAR